MSQQVSRAPDEDVLLRSLLCVPWCSPPRPPLVIPPCLGSPQQGEEDGQEQRLAVRDEDLVEAKDKLGTQGPLKSKTYEVMAECEKAGKAAPSVFSSARSGGETAFSKTANQRPLRK
ncbi:unnamed protein product [Arctogadus glacialis]